MFKKGLLKQLSILLVGSNLIFGQVVVEMNSPDFIKSIIFKSQNEKYQLPIITLGETFEISFDDLNADERNYYYRIKYFNYDWTPSGLFKTDRTGCFDVFFPPNEDGSILIFFSASVSDSILAILL